MLDRQVVIVSACRTAIGNFMGSLAEFSPGDLGAIVVREAVRRAGIPPESVDEVILGCILSAGHGQGVARQSAIRGGIPVTTPAYTVNKLCGSGLKAIMLGAQSILLGDAEVVVAGGVESMSQAPYLLPGARRGLRMGAAQFLDSLVTDGLTDVFSNQHMGITAENIAEQYGILRADQDQFACWSQVKAVAAVQGGRFTTEIVPVTIPQRKGETLVFNQDEYPRSGCSLESLAKLKPAFKLDGTVTAGNASGINDGAAAVILMSASRATDLGLTPLARIKAYGVGAVEPAVMGLGPIPASRNAMQKAGMSMRDVKLVELNEAFAVQAIAVQRDLEIPEEKLNVNGGAIALGHPIGASGARIAVSLLYAMASQDAGVGLATLCIGGGMGAAMIFERV